MTQIVHTVDGMRANGMTAQAAFKAYAEAYDLKAANVQAAYYAQRKKKEPAKPESLSSQLRKLTSHVQDLEDRLAEYESIPIPQL